VIHRALELHSNRSGHRTRACKIPSMTSCFKR
jgi:hypothetical protein